MRFICNCGMHYNRLDLLLQHLRIAHGLTFRASTLGVDPRARATEARRRGLPVRRGVA